MHGCHTRRPSSVAWHLGSDGDIGERGEPDRRGPRAVPLIEGCIAMGCASSVGDGHRAASRDGSRRPASAGGDVGRRPSRGGPRFVSPSNGRLAVFRRRGGAPRRVGCSRGDQRRGDRSALCCVGRARPVGRPAGARVDPPSNLEHRPQLSILRELSSDRHRRPTAGVRADAVAGSWSSARGRLGLLPVYPLLGQTDVTLRAQE